MKLLWLTICLTLYAASAFAQEAPQAKLKTVELQAHNYVPLREAQIEFKDFTFPTLDGSPLNLRQAARGKQRVLIHYFATWCHNSNFDVQTMTEAYDKYRAQGFLVIGVCEYSTKDELRRFIEKHKPTYPICLELTADGKKRERTTSTHYAYRKQVGDERDWGTPLNVLLTAADLEPQGEVVARRVRIAPGEIIKSELGELLRAQ